MDCHAIIPNLPTAKRMRNFSLSAQALLRHAQKQALKAEKCRLSGNPEGAAAWKRLEQSTRREANFLQQQKYILSEVINNPKGTEKCA